MTVAAFCVEILVPHRCVASNPLEAGVGVGCHRRVYRSVQHPARAERQCCARRWEVALSSLSATLPRVVVVRPVPS